MLTGEEELAELVGLLDKVEQRRNGYMACCPCHDDRNPSLSLKVGYTGKLVVQCFSGCDSEDVLRELSRLQRSGNTMTKTGVGSVNGKAKNAAPKPSTKVNRPPREAWSREAVRAYGKYNHEYEYRLPSGQHAFSVFRRDATVNGAGKDIKPWHQDGKRWLNVMPDWASEPNSRPLYRLLSIEATPQDQPICVAEGEACCDLIVSKYLFTAVTSSGGYQAPNKTDWTPLAKRRVVIVPDNDKAGGEYADKVAKILDDLGCEVYLLRLPELPPKGDVVDWHGLKLAEGLTDADIRTAFSELLATATPYRRPVEQIEWDEPDDVGTAFLEGRIDEATYEHNTNPPAVSLVRSADIQTATIMPMDNSDDAIDECDLEEYPTDCLGESLASWVRGCGQSIAVPDSALGTAVLPVLTGLIGRTRRLRIRDKYEVPATMMAIMVSIPGYGKSRTMDQVRDRMLVIDKEVKSSGENRQVWMDNATPEAMLQVISRNPRSLSVVDEFAVFIDLLSRYSQGGGVGLSHVTSLWDGKSVRLNRKGADGKGEMVDIPNASLSLLSNTTEPEALFKRDVVKTGFTSRLLIAEPNWTESDWVWEVPNGEKLDNQLLGIMRSLWNLSPMDRYDDPLTQVLGINEGAMEPWQDYHSHLNAHRKAAKADGNKPYLSCLARVDAQAARLALVLHEVAVATGEHDGPRNEVSRLTMDNAWKLASWYAGEAYRLYQEHGEQQGGKGKDGKGQGDKTPLLESTKPLLWILGKLQECGRLRVSDVQKGVSAHRHKIDATMMQHYVEQWVSHGILQWLDSDKIWFGLANKKSPTK